MAPADRFSIGIDLGGTNLRIAAYSAELEQLSAIKLPTRLAAGPHAVLDDMAEAVGSLRATHGGAGGFAGVGIGSPGPIELPEGKLAYLPNLPGFERLHLRDELSARTDAKVVVENDANAAALAECRAGAGKKYGVNSMAMLTLGTGVGGGIVLNGRPWHGAFGMAGEPGHTVVYPEGLPCACGSRGCLELYASATAVRDAAKRAGRFSEAEISAHAVADKAREGDSAAMKIYEDAGRALGLGLAIWVNTLNLSLYTIGGGMSQAWDLISPAMFEALRASSQIYRLTEPDDIDVFEPGRTNVSPALLGPDAGLMGAAILPLLG